MLLAKRTAQRALSRLAASRPQSRCLSAIASAPAAHLRDDRFSSVTDSDLAHFRDILSPSGVVTDADSLLALNSDWMGRYHGRSSVALHPRTTAEVSAILTHCHARRLAVVPQGGNTGLVGGSVPVHDEILLCLSKMNDIESFDADAGVAVAGAGVVLEALDAHVAAHGFRVPLDLGAKGSCQIGGNVATNAGGSRFLRYGSLRASVLGLEAVLPDGRVLDVLTTLRKDNTGYDVKQLLIGSEGTLGVITRLAVACPPRSAAVDVVALQVDAFHHVPELLRLAKQRLGETLSAYEYMDAGSVDLALKTLDHVSSPLEPEGATGYVLIECAGSDGVHNRRKLDKFVEDAFESGAAFNGVVAENETQAAALWELRESFSEAIARAGKAGTLKYDISLPISVFNEAIVTARERIAHVPQATAVGYGHIGDGNLHLNVVVGEGGDVDAVKAAMEPWVYEFVQKHRGSVSAEHGLGQMKAHAIGYSKGEVAVDVMRAVKNVLDERGICNPYKVLVDP